MTLAELAKEWQAQFARRPQLLIVDDQPINIRVLHELFRQDCEIMMATGGQQALALCATQMPDLLLLDVEMPGMDGHDVCRHLKQQGNGGITAPVIFVTARHDTDDEVLGLELGAVDYISKPIRPEIVRARVCTHLLLQLQTERLRKIAMIDGLTGVANRRQFDSFIQSAWRLAKRDQRPLSLLMLDVDYFKRFNDRYGHLAGDDCLRAVAQAMQTALRRPFDFLARIGGEEFACVLPDTDATGARTIANELLASVLALQIPHEGSDASRNVTISIGGATCEPWGALTIKEFMAAADQRLYHAKGNGRAQVSCALLELPSPA